MSEVGSVPIYSEIQRDVERQILSGAWPPGTRIPSESELVTRYGCARMTVNKAMSNLAASGLIVRRRRSGSFVAPPKTQEPLTRIQDIQADVVASGRVHRYRILGRTLRAAEAAEAERIGVAVGTRLLSLEVLHFADEERLAVERRDINLVAVPRAERESFATEPPGTWLLQHVPWSEAEHVIQAIPADPLGSRRLKIPLGSSCLAITRRTWNDGALITCGTLIYPGERHRFVARFTPHSAT
jgi:GntR family histidine utilization transcriptional repressor